MSFHWNQGITMLFNNFHDGYWTSRPQSEKKCEDMREQMSMCADAEDMGSGG